MGGVRGVGAANDFDTEFRNGEQRAPNRRRPQRSVVQLSTFHKEARPLRCSSEPTDLVPESAPKHSRVQVQYGLSFDYRPSCDIVADREMANLGLNPTRGQRLDDSALPLVDVNDDEQLHGHSLCLGTEHH